MGNVLLLFLSAVLLHGCEGEEEINVKDNQYAVITESGEPGTMNELYRDIMSEVNNLPYLADVGVGVEKIEFKSIIPFD